MGEVGDMLSGIVSELRNFNEEDDGRVNSFRNRGTNCRICRSNTTQPKPMSIKLPMCWAIGAADQNSAMLDKMYDMNMIYFELNMYVSK